MLDLKKAIIVFHYVEQIKSNLLIIVPLIDVLESMDDAEIVGAEKILVAYLNLLLQEVKININVSGIQGFQKVYGKLEKAVEQIKQHNYTNARQLVSEAISTATTKGNEAATALSEKGLI